MEESDALYPDTCDFYGHLYEHYLDHPCDSDTAVPVPEEAPPPPPPPVEEPSTSMLVTGFGMRNLESLQKALLDDEQRRQMLLAQYDKESDVECSSISSSTTSYLVTKTSFTSTQARVSGRARKLSLRYLMGLDDAAEEGGEIPYKGKPLIVEGHAMGGEEEDEATRKMTLAMRQARKYLREHRIFDFFKFIIAHMLSEMPENPIEFIMDLLDKCLLYRSGFGNPPLLFEKAHVEQLFYLMDRMKTGFVDVEQYQTGMKTLGIAAYDKKPPLSTEGLVSQEFFVEEACECLTDLLVEMIRSHGAPTTPPSFRTPPPTVATDLLMDAA